jgi:hypothetical protein
MTRSRSLKKHQRKAKKRPAAGADAKPASAPAAAAKPSSPVPAAPVAAPVADPATAKGAAKVRRRTPAQRERRQLKEKVQRLEKKVAHFSACEKHLARAMEQFAAAKTQIERAQLRDALLAEPASAQLVVLRQGAFLISPVSSFPVSMVGHTNAIFPCRISACRASGAVVAGMPCEMGSKLIMGRADVTWEDGKGRELSRWLG